MIGLVILGLVLADPRLRRREPPRRSRRTSFERVVVGAGEMGAGIARRPGRSGREVLLHDAMPGRRRPRALETMRRSLASSPEGRPGARRRPRPRHRRRRARRGRPAHRGDRRERGGEEEAVGQPTRRCRRRPSSRRTRPRSRSRAQPLAQRLAPARCLACISIRSRCSRSSTSSARSRPRTKTAAAIVQLARDLWEYSCGGESLPAFVGPDPRRCFITRRRTP